MNLLPSEISHQTVPRTTTEETDPWHITSTRPLHELASYAPALDSTQFNPGRAHFAYANDELATYWQQLTARTGTPEYRTATNRTALLVGESSLAAALPYIPENTIIIADTNPDACIYMQHYIDTLRSAPGIKEWHEQMARVLYPDYTEAALGLHGSEVFISYTLQRQVRQWQDAGLRHSLADPDTYERSQELARQKAIIPWKADLADQADMQALGQALREYQATITMVNLTNVINWVSNTENTARPLAIGELPVAEHAPMLVTSSLALPQELKNKLTEARKSKGQESTHLLDAAGPFFGFRNLLEQGGSGLIVDEDEKLAHAVYRRQY